MSRLIRNLALVLGAIGSVAAPCAPAFAAAGCAMPGCENDSPGLSAPMPCCCSGNQAPAGTSSSGSAATLQPVAIPLGGIAGQPGSGPASLPVEANAGCPETSPLYIRHTALLM